MKKIRLNTIFLIVIFLTIPFVTIFGNNPINIKFTIKHYNGTALNIKIGNETNKVIINNNGEGAIDLLLDKPTYGKLLIDNFNSYPLFLVPGTKLMISFLTNDKKVDSLKFTGDLSRENTFLQNPRNYSFGKVTINTKDDESKNSEMLDSLIKENQKKLEAQKLSETFKNLEKERIRYLSYKRLTMNYSINDANVTHFTSLLKSKMIENPDLMVIDEYLDFLISANKQLNYFAKGKISIEGDENRRNRVNQIVQNTKTPQILSYLVDDVLFPVVQNGEPADLIALYFKYVTDPKRIEALNKCLTAFERIKKGKPCPPFSFKDTNDHLVSLKELQGKYVYIDFWATWCGPCKGEIPHMQMLEDKFKGKNICFVSISVDKNSDIQAWKKMIAENKMGGFQLHLGENWPWLKNFMPGNISIPRFLLLDKNGDFISSNMSRPSDEQTAVTINGLPGL